MRSWIPGTLVCLACLTGCVEQKSPSAQQETLAESESSEPETTITVISVAAASDLKYVMVELIQEFQRLHPGTEVRATYGSSGNLFAQLSNKAPFDIFFSADTEYPHTLVEQGQAIPDTEFQYAIGQLVVWVRNESPLNVETPALNVLLTPTVKKIAMANPKHAPYGRAAEAALRTSGIYDQVSERLVLGENVAQAAQFTESGAADAGLISHSLATAVAMNDKGRYSIVPTDLYPKLVQGGVILSWAVDRGATEAFRDFATGDQGRGVLKRHGFLLPGEQQVDFSAAYLSLKLAACTTTILVVVGLPLAYWLTMSTFRGKFLIEAIVALPLVLPPTVLGFYILLATSPLSAFGKIYEQVVGTRLPFSFPGILLGSVLFNLPFAVRPFAAAFAGMNRRLIESSWCLGVSRWRTFWRITVPLCWPGILAGAVLTFAHSVGEFGVVLMVGGNIPGVTRTLSISIYDDVQALNYEAAGQTAFGLVLFSFGVLSLVQWLGRQRRTL